MNRYIQTLVTLATLSTLLSASPNPFDDILSFNRPNPNCLLKPQGGPCKGLFTKYYYDTKTDSCKSFIYGGCEGVVPFDTKEQCQKSCINGGDMGMIVKKPAIYLYPPKTLDIKVSLQPKGEIISSNPNYGNGWSVRANSDGSLEGGYGYLFYEVQLQNSETPTNGWVIATKGLHAWFDENLPKLGLNPKEINDFKEYWLTKLTTTVPFYKISLLSEAFMEENMALTIDPKPDTLIRLNFRFEPLQNDEAIIQPIIKTPKREGFVAVEWGGVLATPIH